MKFRKKIYYLVDFLSSFENLLTDTNLIKNAFANSHQLQTVVYIGLLLLLL